DAVPADAGHDLSDVGGLLLARDRICLGRGRPPGRLSPGDEFTPHAATPRGATLRSSAPETDLHPQPAFPLSFAAASRAQQASVLAGAGPPQHPAAPVATGALQTPVSGRTRRTSLAASWSPAMSATTERTCS